MKTDLPTMPQMLTAALDLCRDEAIRQGHPADADWEPTEADCEWIAYELVAQAGMPLGLIRNPRSLASIQDACDAQDAARLTPIL